MIAIGKGQKVKKAIEKSVNRDLKNHPYLQKVPSVSLKMIKFGLKKYAAIEKTKGLLTLKKSRLIPESYLNKKPPQKIKPHP